MFVLFFSQFSIESMKMEDVSPGPSYEGVDDSQDGCIESGGSLDGCLEQDPENVLLMKEVSPSERDEINCFRMSSDQNLSIMDVQTNSSSSNSQVLGQARDPDEMFSAWLLSELGQIDDEYVKDELKIELMRKCNEAKRTCRLRKIQSVPHLNRSGLGPDHHVTRSVSPQLAARPLYPPQHSPHSTQLSRTT